MSGSKLILQEFQDIKSKQYPLNYKTLKIQKSSNDSIAQENEITSVQNCSNLIQFLSQKNKETKMSKRAKFNKSRPKSKRKSSDGEQNISLPDLKKDNLFDQKEIKQIKTKQPSFISYKQSIIQQKGRIKTPVFSNKIKFKSSVDLTIFESSNNLPELKKLKTPDPPFKQKSINKKNQKFKGKQIILQQSKVEEPPFNYQPKINNLPRKKVVNLNKKLQCQSSKFSYKFLSGSQIKIQNSVDNIKFDLLHNQELSP